MYLETKTKFFQQLKEKHSKSPLSMFWGKTYNLDKTYNLVQIQQSIKNFVYAIPRMGKNIVVHFATSRGATGHCQKIYGGYKIVLDPFIYEDTKEKYSLNEIINIYSGLVFHECAHALYTKKFQALANRTELGRLCWNYLEDNRIEYLFDKSYSNLSPYLISTNNYLDQRKSTEGPADLLTAIILSLQNLLRQEKIEFPNLETPSGVNVVSAMRDFFSKYEFSEDFSYIEKMSFDLEKFILELLNDFGSEFPEQQTRQEELQSVKEAFDKLPQEIKDLLTTILKEIEGQIKGQLSEKESDKIKELNCIADSNEDYEKVKIPEELRYVYPEEDGSKSKFESVIKFAKPTNEMNVLYRELVDKDRNVISKLRNMFVARLQTKEFTDPQKLRGQIDKRGLFRGGFTETIFKQNFEVKSEGIAVAILLDESGSMGNVNSEGSKAYNCRRAALILQQVFSGIRDVELEMYSFTGNRENLITYLYGSQLPHKCAIMKYDPGEQNYDHVALWQANLLLRKYTKNKNKLLFIISDGQPCGHGYGDMSAIRLVKAEVDKIQSHGIQVIQLAIEGSTASEQMYTNWVEFKDTNTLTTDFVRLFNLVIRKYL